MTTKPKWQTYDELKQAMLSYMRNHLATYEGGVWVGNEGNLNDLPDVDDGDDLELQEEIWHLGEWYDSPLDEFLRDCLDTIVAEGRQALALRNVGKEKRKVRRRRAVDD